MLNFFHDLRYGVRTLSKRPGFAATAIITLALGIGLNTTIFSLFNAAVLKQLPVRDASRVVDLYSRQPESNRLSVFSYPEFVFYRDNNTAFEGVAAFAGTRVLLGNAASSGADGRPEWIHGALVSGNYFDLLGTRAALGRTFLPEEDKVPGANPVVVLSYGAWQSRFGGDPKLIGKTIKFNDLQYTVIGVAPASFIGTEPGLPDFWIPMMMSGNAHFGPTWLDQRDSGWLRLVARLKPDANLQIASSEMAVLASRFHAADTVQTARAATTIVAPAGMLNPDEQSDAIPFAVLLLAAVTLVLLIACANVANLQLARGLSRQKEMGIRTSLGATRGRLIRQLFAEELVLAAAAGGLGLLLAWWGAGLMLAILQPPGENSLLLSLTPDWRVIAYALGISLLAAIVSGIVPALRVSRQDPLHAMKEDGGASGFHATSKARAFLVVSQVSLAFFLLLGAGLLARALGKARNVDPGFNTTHVAVLAPELRARNYDQNRRTQFNRDLVERIRTLPGVQNVAFSRSVPLSTDFMQTAAMAEGNEPPPDQQPKLVNFNEVSADFFSTLGIPIPRGRAFTPAEVSQGARVVVISASLAEMLWPGEDAIGKRLRSGRTSPTYEVVGVANDVRNVYLWSQKVPYLYRPPAVRTSKDEDIMDAKILVRTNSDPSGLIASLPALSRDLDPTVPVSAQILSENIATWVWPSQLGAAVSTALGLLAMLLASVGIAGVTSFAVSQRTREIGIRMALGADSRAVVRQFIGQMSRLVLIGTAVGLALGILASRLLSSFLYGLSALDAFAFIAVTIFMLAVSLVASYIPARRAMRVDPMIALRYE